MKRDRWVLATKVGYVSPDGEQDFEVDLQPFSPAAVGQDSGALQVTTSIGSVSRSRSWLTTPLWLIMTCAGPISE